MARVSRSATQIRRKNNVLTSRSTCTMTVHLLTVVGTQMPGEPLLRALSYRLLSTLIQIPNHGETSELKALTLRPSRN
jgi:hypothetical protein